MATATKLPPPPANAKASAPPVQVRGLADPPRPEEMLLGWSIVINGVEKWGKTTMAAYAPGSALIVSPSDLSGYMMLYKDGLVPKRQTATPGNWLELFAIIDGIIANPGELKTLALDALGGFERLCHEHVCAQQFGGDWGEKGFISFHKGYDISVAEWMKFLARLDRLKMAGVNVLMLSHVKTQAFRNPLGLDYDRYVPDCHAKTWGVTHKWADNIMFANFADTVQEKKGRTKGVTGQRVLFTQRTAAYDAGGRMRLPFEIDIPNNAAQAWATFENALNAGKAGE